MLYKYSGPPGTGKSTTLLNVVDSLLTSGVDPEDIVYTTFTRAGAYEARDRACARFNLSVNRLPYFKTLHALCYSLLPKSDVMSFLDWGVVGKHIGAPLRIRSAEDTTSLQGATRGDRLLGLWSLSRMSMETLAATHARCEPSYSGPHKIALSELEHFAATVTNYKASFGKIDFTDMLSKWLEEGLEVHASHVIVDEAQDLSALQWKVVDKLCSRARNVWVAGDDDQCIHEWNGASPRHFIELPAQHYEVLAQSHRIPASVHNLAEKIITQVKTRLPKTYRPREDAGRVIRVADLQTVNLNKDTWLLLARNKTFLRDYVKLCRERGVRYCAQDLKDEVDPEVIQAIATWKELQRLTQDITAARAKVLYKFLSRRDRVVNGFKSRINEVKDDVLLNYAALAKDYGLVAIITQPWWSVLDMLPEDTVAYLRAIENNNEDITLPPRIRISTIHGAKGQEADHVVLRPDMAQQTHAAYQHDPDNEHRVWYVGVTRARQDLYLLHPTESNAYPL